MMSRLSDAARATILFCTRLGMSAQCMARPFSAQAWHVLRRRLSSCGDPIRSLLYDNETDLRSKFVEEESIRRILALRKRENLLDAIEALNREYGIQVFLRGEDGFPPGLEKLDAACPNVLYAAGNTDLLCGGQVRLGVVGAREASEEAVRFARTLGRACADNGVCVVSGGARGVDIETQMAALDAGGGSVFVLPYGLASREAQALAGRLPGRYALVSSEETGARFSPARALARNALIYTLSGAAVVVQSRAGQGGSFAGAVQCWRKKWCSLFACRMQKDPLGGNARLIEMGAAPICEGEIEGLVKKIAADKSGF